MSHKRDIHYNESVLYILFNDYQILARSSTQLTIFFLLFQVSTNDKHEWLLLKGTPREGTVTAYTEARREGVLCFVPLFVCK